MNRPDEENASASAPWATVLVLASLAACYMQPLGPAKQATAQASTKKSAPDAVPAPLAAAAPIAGGSTGPLPWPNELQDATGPMTGSSSPAPVPDDTSPFLEQSVSTADFEGTIRLDLGTSELRTQLRRRSNGTSIVSSRSIASVRISGKEDSQPFAPKVFAVDSRLDVLIGGVLFKTGAPALLPIRDIASGDHGDDAKRADSPQGASYRGRMETPKSIVAIPQRPGLFAVLDESGAVLLYDATISIMDGLPLAPVLASRRGSGLDRASVLEVGVPDPPDKYSPAAFHVLSVMERPDDPEAVLAYLYDNDGDGRIEDGFYWSATDGAWESAIPPPKPAAAAASPK